MHRITQLTRHPQLTRRRAARLTSLAVFSSLAAVPLVLSGCGNHASSSGGGDSLVASGTDSGPAATLTTPKNNVLSLSQTEFYDQLQGFIPNSPQGSAPAGQPAGRLVIQQLLQNLMVEGLAQDQGVAPTDAEVSQQYDNIKLIQETRSTKPFDQALADAGLTTDAFKDLQVKPQLAQIKLLTKGATVSDADITAFYNANKDKAFTEPPRVHIKHIAVGSLAQAQQISKAIAGGQTFESQVVQSTDKSSPDGDIAQWIPLDPAPPSLGPLLGPIKSAKTGFVTAPIAVGPSSFWIVKVVDRVDQKQVEPQDKVKELIRAQLLQQKAAADPQAQQQFQQQLRDFAGTVKITAPTQYASVVQALTHPAPPPPSLPSPGGPAPGGPAPGGAPAPGSSPFAPAAHP